MSAPVTVRLPAWEKWQGPALKDVREKRKHRGTDSSRPYAMSFFSLTSAFDDGFSRFAEQVGGGLAETYMVRLLQHVALHAALAGAFRVSPDAFGPAVLSRPWHVVSGAQGRRVLAAFVSAGVLEIEGGGVGDASETCRRRGGDVSGTDEMRRDETKGVSAVDVDRPPLSLPIPAATTLSTCDRCNDTGYTPGKKCCRRCAKGRGLALAHRRAQAAEEESAARARKAREERGAYAPAPGSLEEGAA